MLRFSLFQLIINSLVFMLFFSVGIRVNIVIDSASFCIIIVLLVDSFRFVNRVSVYFQVSELNLGRSWAAG